MKTLYINPLHPSFTLEMSQAFQNGYTVFCCQRPFPCDQSWQANSIGNGIFYGYIKDIENTPYKKDLERLDVSMIQIQTNDDIIKLIEKECIENGTTLQEILQCTSLEQLANDLGYCYIKSN
jgi:hypothetical protein